MENLLGKKLPKDKSRGNKWQNLGFSSLTLKDKHGVDAASRGCGGVQQGWLFYMMARGLALS